MHNRKLLLLIDFSGHPALGDHQMNTLRYDYLQHLIFSKCKDGKKLMIVSNHPSYDSKLTEILRMAKANNHLVITAHPEKEFTVRDIEQLAMSNNINIFSVYVVGTNKSACVLHSKKWSAVEWAKEGYDTTILLQLCGEYEIPGTSYEKALKSIYMIYKTIVSENLFNTLKIYVGNIR